MPDDRILSEEEIQRELKTLPDWEIRDGWLRRKYKTPGWSHTMMLANTIGYLAEAANHHPDLELGYAQVIFKIQTHRVRGITPMDIAFARKVHEVVTWMPEEESALDGFPKRWIQ